MAVKEAAAERSQEAGWALTRGPGHPQVEGPLLEEGEEEGVTVGVTKLPRVAGI